MRNCHSVDRRIVLTLLILLTVAGPAFARDEKPSDFLTKVYRTALGPSGDASDGGSIFYDEGNRRRFLSRGLRASFATMLRRTPKGDAPNLDFDPVSNGNDPSVHDLHIKTESENGARAVVIADFVSDQDTVRSVLRYFLVRESGDWKIDDIVATGKAEWRVKEIIERN